MHRRITFGLLLMLLFGCEQVPTSMDEEPYIPGSEVINFEVSVESFDFDYFTQSFFASSKATSSHDDLLVSARLYVEDSLVDTMALNDAGTGGDIQAGDGSFDMNWLLPDSLLEELNRSWKLEITARSNGATKSVTQLLDPEIPRAPVVESVSHQDTLYLPSSGLVFDTIRVAVSHVDGLDEIRDVSFRSLKPNGEYASGGNPIPLLDDGGALVLYEYFGIKITSGDSLANDGIFSLTVPLSATDLAGKYTWTFTSRSWEGLTSEVFEDSLHVLSGPGVTP